jgi:hypothetical protein
MLGHSIVSQHFMEPEGSIPNSQVSRELARYKLDLVGVQEIRWEGGDTEPAGEYILFYGKGNKKQLHT